MHSPGNNVSHPEPRLRSLPLAVAHTVTSLDGPRSASRSPTWPTPPLHPFPVPWTPLLGVILGLCRQRARLPIRRTLLSESHSFHTPALAPFLEYSRHLVLLSGCQNELTGSTPTHRQCSSRGSRPPLATTFALPLSRSATPPRHGPLSNICLPVFFQVMLLMCCRSQREVTKLPTCQEELYRLYLIQPHSGITKCPKWPGPAVLG